MNAIDEYFLKFIKDQERWADQQGGVVNHDIYEQRLTDPDTNKWPTYRLTPYSMYFYYVRINSNGRLVIDHYFYATGGEDHPDKWTKIPHDKNGLHDLVKQLALNARPSVKPADKNPPRKMKGDFKKSEWQHKSYVAIFFDEANWTFRKKTAGSGESAVTFIVKDGDKVGTPNHSFFDAIDLAITMPIRRPGREGLTEDTRSAIVFVNHMKADEAGRDLQDDDDQEFVFKMILDVNSESQDDPPTVFIIDPGGTNGGTSVPPPP